MQPAVEAALPEGEGCLPQEVRPGELLWEPPLEMENSWRPLGTCFKLLLGLASGQTNR